MKQETNGGKLGGKNGGHYNQAQTILDKPLPT